MTKHWKYIETTLKTTLAGVLWCMICKTNFITTPYTRHTYLLLYGGMIKTTWCRTCNTHFIARSEILQYAVVVLIWAHICNQALINQCCLSGCSKRDGDTGSKLEKQFNGLLTTLYRAVSLNVDYNPYLYIHMEINDDFSQLFH